MTQPMYREKNFKPSGTKGQRKTNKMLFLFFCVVSCFLNADAKSQYEGLDPTSISQHLAFYELYKDNPLGQKALKHAWKLLSGKEDVTVPLQFPTTADAFLSLINLSEKTNKQEIDDQALSFLNEICKELPNRKLKGHKVETIAELLSLNPNEIDLARSLLIAQGEKDARTIALFEAGLDLMALQVLSRTPIFSSSQAKVEAINDLIFFELGFRFPPHSSYSQEIDLFTFLPQVLESRRGVCLGVSTLYLCIAQRVGLDVEIITPPGHIYLKAGARNIETTLRGVHIPSEDYLGINLIKLPKRTMKEVIGMAFFNQASVYLSQADFQKASVCYEKATLYMPHDATLNTLFACSLYLCNHEERARNKLKGFLQKEPRHAISEDPLTRDILENRVDREGLASIFLYVDETRASIIKKKEALIKATTHSPSFRSGLFHLAICHLQLNEPKEAIQALARYHALNSHDISCEFYLAELYASRFDAPSSYKHLMQAEELARIAGCAPLALRDFKAKLAIQSPS